MAHLYKISEWETASGRWVCNDIEELTTSASKWYAPARVLGISPEDFVLLLIEKFKVSYINYYKEQNFLVYWWNDRQACRDFKNYVNAVARKKQFIVGD